MKIIARTIRRQSRLQVMELTEKAAPRLAKADKANLVSLVALADLVNPEVWNRAVATALARWAILVVVISEKWIAVQTRAICKSNSPEC